MGSQVIDLDQGVIHLSIRMTRRYDQPYRVRVVAEYGDHSEDTFAYETRDAHALPNSGALIGMNRADVRKLFTLINVSPLIPLQR